VADGLLAKLLDGDVVEDLALVDDPVVPLVAVGVEGDVGDNDRVGALLLDEGDGARDEAGRVVRLLAVV